MSLSDVAVPINGVAEHLGDRTSPKEWVELTKPDLVEKVIARKEEILFAPSKARFDPMLDAELRSKFNIHLLS